MILIVEDNEINAMIFESYIQELGIGTDIAENGQIALEKIKFLLPSLILMDIHMPIMNGLDTIQNIRKLGITLPIIAISASTNNGEEEKALSLGADAFVSKPVHGSFLKNLIKKYL